MIKDDGRLEDKIETRSENIKVCAVNLLNENEIPAANEKIDFEKRTCGVCSTWC